MALNTYPYSPFPASTEQLHKGDNEDLQAQINAIKDGTDIDSFGDVENALSVVTGDITNIETDKADLEVVAAEFNAEAGTYDVGDLVTYDGKLYEFTSAHSTAGAWDPTEVTEKTIADEIDTLKSGLTNLGNLSMACIMANHNSDGQHYYIDLSRFTFSGGRGPVIVMFGSQGGGAKIEVGMQNNGDFVFPADSGITWDSTNKKIEVDEGSSAWTIPYLIIPKTIIS